MLGHLVIAVLGLLVLLGLWLVVQGLARRALAPDNPERDVLACALCRNGGICHCSGARRDPVRSDL